MGAVVEDVPGIGDMAVVLELPQGVDHRPEGGDHQHVAVSQGEIVGAFPALALVRMALVEGAEVIPMVEVGGLVQEHAPEFLPFEPPGDDHVPGLPLFPDIGIPPAAEFPAIGVDLGA